MKSHRLILLAVTLSTVAVLALAGPAAATTTTHGKFGDFGYLPADSQSNPAGKCGYSEPLSDSYAHLRFIKVRPPEAIARNTTGGRDQQKVTFQVRIQRQGSGGDWSTIKTSAAQSRTAYDDQSANFDPIKVMVNGTNSQLWRAQVILKWWRNGSVEGWGKFPLEWYGVKWTVGTPDYRFDGACTGIAD
jgi:hypothetical protein